jgi:hypothetical protein
MIISTLFFVLALTVAFYTGRRSVPNKSEKPKKEEVIGHLTPGEIVSLEKMDIKHATINDHLKVHFYLLSEYEKAGFDFWDSIEERLGVRGRNLRLERKTYEIYAEVEQGLSR